MIISTAVGPSADLFDKINSIRLFLDSSLRSWMEKTASLKLECLKPQSVEKGGELTDSKRAEFATREPDMVDTFAIIVRTVMCFHPLYISIRWINAKPMRCPWKTLQRRFMLWTDHPSLTPRKQLIYVTSMRCSSCDSQ